MIALLAACLFFEILVHVHVQKRALKLCSATLNLLSGGAFVAVAVAVVVC